MMMVRARLAVSDEFNAVLQQSVRSGAAPVGWRAALEPMHLTRGFHAAIVCVFEDASERLSARRVPKYSRMDRSRSV